MVHMAINLDADGAYPDATSLGNVTSVGLLSKGMQSGKGAVIVQVTLPDGSKHYGQTSVTLLHQAAQAIATRDAMNMQSTGSEY